MVAVNQEVNVDHWSHHGSASFSLWPFPVTQDIHFGVSGAMRNH